MAQYSIKEVETLSGVKAHTLRIWEQRYDILKPHRTDTNIRYYTDDQLRMLLNIGTLNRSGLKISKIAEMDTRQMSEAVLQLHEANEEPDNMLDALVQSMVDFDEQRFEKTLSSAILKWGFENTFVKLISPFMMRTGVLWATGSVRVAQEHFITHLVRRKLFVAIDNQFVTATAHSKRFLLFLPEGETHDLLLLFTEYLLRKHNHLVLCLGSNVPFNELIHTVSSFKPACLVTYLTVPLEKNTLSGYLKKLSGTFGHTKILVGGKQLDMVKTKVPANCTVVNSETELLAAIS